MRGFSYSRWDGSQQGFDLDAGAILGEINDDLLYHGDVNAALRRLMQQGFKDREGRDVSGLRELLAKIREQRRQEREQFDLGGVYSEIAEELDDIVRTERRGLDDLKARADSSGDERRKQVTDEVVANRQMELGLLPDDLAGKVRGLSSYEFTSPQAHEAFEQLMERLRQEVVQSYLDQAAGAMANMGPQERDRLRRALDGLNKMMEDREAGRELDPSFEVFMAEFGDLFPGNPENLDDLLEQLAHHMAATSAMLASMTPGQRQQLSSLMDELMGDMDLSWQVNRLGANLRSMFPDAPWERRVGFSGSRAPGLAEASDAFSRLAELDQLEQLLSGTPQPGALAEIDLDRVRELVGPDASASLGELAKLAKSLEDAGLVENHEGQLQLTPAGLRRIGQRALKELFSRLSKDRLGGHELVLAGSGHERAEATKPYELGDPFNLHIERTVRNAIGREAERLDAHGGGVSEPGDGPRAAVSFPVRLHPDDFEIETTEHLTRCATVLLVDLSLSMPMRDNFLAAKKVAMALHSLISSQFPRDYLGIVGFSEVAREIRPAQLPEVSWDFVYGTNMQHAFLLARRMLGRQHGTKQIVMITDGEPTAHLMEDGEVFFNYPPVRATVDATLAEVLRMTREGIRLNTFALDATGHLRDFVEKITRLNRGRAFFTTPETLGDYVLVDFIENRQSMSPGAGPVTGRRRRLACSVGSAVRGEIRSRGRRHG
ncbi:MAG: vWA domain-containing protein [Acidimicrobiales bacterium]